MKYWKVSTIFILAVFALTACGPQAEQPAAADDSTVAGPAAIADATALVGTWRGRPAGGILEIDEDLHTVFAQNLDDLLGNRKDPTLYKGSIEIDGSRLYVEDSRCEDEGPGIYEAIPLDSDGLQFILVEDKCTHRVNNLVGQRVEPQIEVTWFPIETE